MIFLQRPTNSLNKYHNKAMPEPAKEGDTLQSQLVYYKIREDVKTTKQLINGLNKLRPGESKGNAEAQMKRAILCGRDQTKYRMVDILDGLSDADIASSMWTLTPSQHDFIYISVLSADLQRNRPSSRPSWIRKDNHHQGPSGNRNQARSQGCHCHRVQLCCRQCHRGHR